MSWFSFIHGSLRNSIKSQTLWLHCRVSGGQVVNPLRAVFSFHALLETGAAVTLLRYELSSGGVWGNKRKSWNKPKEEQRRFLGTLFTAQRLQQRSISSRRHWWMQTLFMRHKVQKAGWADWVSEGHLSSRTTENWCPDSAPHLDPVMWVEVAPHANNLLLIAVACWFSLLLSSAGDQMNVCNKTRAHRPSR